MKKRRTIALVYAAERLRKRNNGSSLINVGWHRRWSPGSQRPCYTYTAQTPTEEGKSQGCGCFRRRQACLGLKNSSPQKPLSRWAHPRPQDLNDRTHLCSASCTTVGASSLCPIVSEREVRSSVLNTVSQRWTGLTFSRLHSVCAASHDHDHLDVVFLLHAVPAGPA